MSFAWLQNYGLEMKTGINAIIYSGEQSLSTHALLNSVFFFFFYCLFCKIFTFFFFLKCSVYFTTANGDKIKANHPWKEKPRCLHQLQQRRGRIRWKPKKHRAGRCWWGRVGGARPQRRLRGLVTGSHVWCHFQPLRETDAPGSVSPSSIKEGLCLTGRVEPRRTAKRFYSTGPAGAPGLLPFSRPRGECRRSSWRDLMFGNVLPLKEVTVPRI